MSNIKFEKGQKFKKWLLSESIGEGGNGKVFEATLLDNSQEKIAIKFFKRFGDTEKYARFKDEIKILKEHADIKGLFPIIDSELPEKPDKHTPPWYAMPLAIPIMKHIEGKGPEQIIDIIISASETLAELHRRGIFHRDIKPDNILELDGSIFLSDFGLVHYPGKTEITKEGEDFGPHWTIAPEMQRNPVKADGKMADVYSMAKTMWILLTKQEKCFEGQYNTGTDNEIKKFQTSIFTGTLDYLLHQSTNDNPGNRPNINEFLNKLLEWKKFNADFIKGAESEWIYFNKKLFPHAMPKRIIWEDIDDIVKILNITGELGQINHTLLPIGGGLDLNGAKLSSCEEGCIELDFAGSTYIVKPKALIFESFRNHLDWSYLRLETEGLKLLRKPINSQVDEVLTELEPCLYTDPACFDYDDFNGACLPPSARIIIRLSKGSCIICLKTGGYNGLTGHFDAYHARMHEKLSADKFRNYIEKIIASLDSGEELKTTATGNLDKFKKPIYIKSTKTRKGSRILSVDEIILIKKVITLSKKANAEYSMLKKKHDLDSTGGLNFSDIETIINIEKSPKPKKYEFNSFLESLSDEKLSLIEAVMHGGIDAGRYGRAHPLDEMLEGFKKNSKQSRLHTIKEKEAQLYLYLAAGIKAYRQDFKR